jgi:adenine phosphoribosyltransferase|tara:strand:- start:30833 stop:31345 length:513 start_codon:yes stop_codon:yes gene_type:complete
MNISNYIRSIDNFPSKGITFRDITPIFQDPNIFNFVIEEMRKYIDKVKPDYLAAIDSRGFLLGSALALSSKIPLILIRKKGKLPPPVISQKYSLEYGDDYLELSSQINLSGKNVIIIDDVLATGGTITAAIKLIEKLEGEVIGLNFLINLINIEKPSEIKNYPINFLKSY